METSGQYAVSTQEGPQMWSRALILPIFAHLSFLSQCFVVEYRWICQFDMLNKGFLTIVSVLQIFYLSYLSYLQFICHMKTYLGLLLPLTSHKSSHNWFFQHWLTCLQSIYKISHQLFIKSQLPSVMNLSMILSWLFLRSVSLSPLIFTSVVSGSGHGSSSSSTAVKCLQLRGCSAAFTAPE